MNKQIQKWEDRLDGRKPALVFEQVKAMQAEIDELRAALAQPEQAGALVMVEALKPEYRAAAHRLGYNDDTALYAHPPAQPASEPRNAVSYKDRATIAGLEASIGHLSALVNEQLLLLEEVDINLGVDGMGVPLDDDQSPTIAKVRAHLAAMSEPEPKSENVWMPIETAPKKHGELLLGWVWYQKTTEDDDGNSVTKELGAVDFIEWQDSEHGGHWMAMAGPWGDYSDGITHWMPLPTPPSEGL